MKTRIKQMWASALRSGKYKKTTGQLKKDRDGEACFCVMGVLADLYLQENQKEWGYESKIHPSHGCLGGEAILWAGLEHHQQDELIRANDGSTKSFEELADMVEAL